MRRRTTTTPPHAAAARRRWVRSGTLLAAVAALGTVVVVGARGATTANWSVYHGTAAGSGAATGVTSVDTSGRAWTSPVLDGQIYGSPLTVGNGVFVATEANRIYELSGSTGKVIWSRRIATPVPASALPCGNIAPTVGITGTPVVDVARHEIFAVADEWVHHRAVHVLVGLSTVNGAVRMRRAVDPPRSGRRSSCCNAPGSTSPPARWSSGSAATTATAGTTAGASWPSASAAGRRGSSPSMPRPDSARARSGWAAPPPRWTPRAASGSASATARSPRRGSAYDHSDAVLELTPALHLVQYFAPGTWATDNANDADLSTAPALLANGKVVASGKSRSAYLLNGAHLGGINHQQATIHNVCDSIVTGGPAVVGNTVYLPCLSGPVAVHVTSSPPRLSIRWRAGAGGGPPIVAANRVWTIGQDGVLYGLDPSSGAVRQQASIGSVANHFPTPSVGDGLLLAPASNRVVAFRTAS